MSTAGPVPPPRADADPAPATRAAILVVDDNANKRTALRAVLEPLDYEIVEADSGVAALRCISAQDFAVILLDVQMPQMDGFETAALIRLRARSELTPIIFVTSYDFDEIMTDRYAQGAVDFMIAPFRPDELRAKVTVLGNMATNAADLASRAREAQMSADQLRLLTDSAPIGIFQTDAAHRYVYTNPRWSEVTGLPAGQVAGRPWDVILRAEDRAAFRTVSAQAQLREGLSHRFRTGPESEPRTVLVTSRPMHDAGGTPTGWVGTLADVTAEVGAESAMADAMDRATEASRLKSDFLANMSHEIRTPMNGVLGMTDLLLETALDPRQRDYAQTVRNSGEALLTIINDILDFSKVEAGMLEVEVVEFDVRAIVQGVVDLLAGPAQAKGLELMAVVDRSVPAVASGDPGRLRQVLTNLVGNALKFTATGEVVVRVEAGDAPQGRELRFEVSDTGIGVPPEQLATIFQPFVQGDTSTARRYGGTGLGLAISTRLVGLMDGACGVHSRPGVGSTFWFTVPVPAEAGPLGPAEVLVDPDLAGVPVLVVDGNDTSRRSLSSQLEEWGAHVDTAGSTSAALEHLREAARKGRPTAVVLVDRCVPGEAGADLQTLLDGDEARAARFVIMTGLGEECLPTGRVRACLSKPVHAEDLRRCLRVAVGVGPTGAAVAPGEPEGPVPRARGRLLLVEDNAINQRVAYEMLTSVGYEVEIAPDGAAGVEAFRDGCFDAVLMDCQMPEMNGYEATAAIRALEGPGRRTPVIAMTAGARAEDRERCLAAGMDGYLSKPVSKPVLLAKVALLFKTGSTPPAPRGPAPDRTETERPDEGVLDADVLAELRAVGEEDFVTDLLEEFLRDAATRLEELAGAVRSEDPAHVTRVLHAVRGSSATVGGRRLASCCARLEQRLRAGGPEVGPDDLHGVRQELEALRRALANELSTPRPA